MAKGFSTYLVFKEFVSVAFGICALVFSVFSYFYLQGVIKLNGVQFTADQLLVISLILLFLAGVALILNTIGDFRNWILQ